jgi:MscS family membrane protein
VCIDKVFESGEHSTMKELLLSYFSEQALSVNVVGLAVWQWIGLFGLILISVVVSTLCARVLELSLIRGLSRLFGLSDFFQKKGHLFFAKPINIILLGWIFLLGVESLGFLDNLVSFLTGLSKVFTFLGLVWLGFRVTDVLQDLINVKTSKTKSKFDDLLAPLFGRTVKAFLTLFGIVSVAEILQLPLSSLLAGLGIGGLAIAMAAKDTIANVFGSLTILVDRPFSIGDWVVVDDVEGSVEDLGFRSTRVRTFYNSLVTIPNAKMLTATVDNMGERRYRRIKMMLGVTYQTPADKIELFCEGIRDIIRQHSATRKDYFHVYFNGFGASSLDILLYCFLETPDWGEELKQRQVLLLSIMTCAENLGISFAYPTQTVFLEKSDN